MNDEEQTKSTENTGEGNKSEGTSLIESANQAAERLEQATAAQEELMAKKRLGGFSEAGQEVPEETEEAKRKAGALDFWKGSSVADAIEKHG